jgi:biotin carboxyl carrier protein
MTKYKIAVGENKYEVEIGAIQNGVAMVTVNTAPYEVKIENFREVVSGGAASARVATTPSSSERPVAPITPARPEAPPPAPPAAGLCVVMAPIPGLVDEIKVCVGDRVAAGQVVAIIEAMKMLNNITAQVAGTVREVRVGKGVEVSTDDVLLIID